MINPLKKLRGKMTQKELARDLEYHTTLGWSLTTIKFLETGRMKLTKDRDYWLCIYAGKKQGYFLKAFEKWEASK